MQTRKTNPRELQRANLLTVVSKVGWPLTVQLQHKLKTVQVQHMTCVEKELIRLKRAIRQFPPLPYEGTYIRTDDDISLRFSFH